MKYAHLLLPDDYLLFIPGYTTPEDDGPDHEPGLIVLYDIIEMLELRDGDANFTHPSDAMHLWGTVPFPAATARRWYERGRFIKAKPRIVSRWDAVKGQTVEEVKFRITYIEPRQVAELLSEEDLFWLKAVCETSEYHKEQLKAQEPPPAPKPERKRLTRKQRREMERRHYEAKHIAR